MHIAQLVVEAVADHEASDGSQTQQLAAVQATQAAVGFVAVSTELTT